MEELTCKISGIVFENRSTGFRVIRAIPVGKSGQITITGNFPHSNVSVGLKAKFSGKWQEHPTYGKELHAVSCEILPEKGRIGIITYLSSHVPSIGPITAAKLYDAFGDDLVQILENQPDQIKELKFLTKIQAEAIINEWKNSSAARTASIFLTDLGLNANQIKSVYTKLGTQTQSSVRADPYCLYDCPGVGFATADCAARKLGIGVDDIRRVKAMILYILNELSQVEGHMYATSTQVQDYAKKLFRRRSLDPFTHGDYIADAHYYSALTALRDAGHVVFAPPAGVYLNRHWKHETESAECLARIISRDPREFDDLEKTLSEFEIAKGVTLAEEQRQAFFMLGRSRACVVSGFPGTGKTLLISAFVHLFEKMNFDYILLSPTGIAAKRLSQVTGKPASTIHRALGYMRDGTWEFNAANKFYADAVIVDEMSMVDGSTFYHLMTALHPDTIVILVGDSAQLPSVGAGYVLNNLMRCSDVPHVALTRIYRQEDQSDIVQVAHSILKGERINTKLNRASQFLFFDLIKDQVVEEICKLTSKMKEKSANFQVIAPMYDGELGVDNLNRKLREVLNSEFASGKAAKLRHGEVDLYEGDRIMVVKNDYDKMIFNGDVGKIQKISQKNDEIEVRIFGWFDHESTVPRYVDKVFTFKVEEALRVLRVAYACTAHKVQGQEFDFVLLPMTRQYGIMLYRNLIYTAITRARKKVFIFGDPNAFAYAVNNDRETVRNSWLNELVSQKIISIHNESAPTSQVFAKAANSD